MRVLKFILRFYQFILFVGLVLVSTPIAWAMNHQTYLTMQNGVKQYGVTSMLGVGFISFLALTFYHQMVIGVSCLAVTVMMALIQSAYRFGLQKQATKRH